MVKLVEAFREQALGKVKDPLLGAHNTEVCTSRGLNHESDAQLNYENNGTCKLSNHWHLRYKPFGVGSPNCYG